MLPSPLPGSCPSPHVFITGMISLIHSVVSRMAGWPGSGQMNSDGLVMPALGFPCTITLF
jgi:hypothetical protein